MSQQQAIQAVLKKSAEPWTLTGKTWVGPASFPSLPYINFGKIVLLVQQVSDLIVKTVLASKQPISGFRDFARFSNKTPYCRFATASQESKLRTFQGPFQDQTQGCSQKTNSGRCAKFPGGVQCCTHSFCQQSRVLTLLFLYVNLKTWWFGA